jgi:hypothetical protein
MNLLKYLFEKYCYGQPSRYTRDDFDAQQDHEMAAPPSNPKKRKTIAEWFNTSIPILLALACLSACDPAPPSSDDIQREQQEKILQEGTSAVGMPGVKNFREKRLLKDIIELRDQEGLTTYTYIVAEMTGKLIFLGESIGYGIPAATQFTNPSKYERVSVSGGGYGYQTLPQADPNGLFSPASAEGTWVMMLNKANGKAQPVYIEPRVIVSPFKIDQ